MIYLIHKSLTAPDKQSILKILSYTDISENECQFIDLAHEDIDIGTKDFIIAINTYKDVAKALISKKVFRTQDLLGSDIYDETTKFCLINISNSIVDIFSKDEIKSLVWQKILNFYAFYSKCGKSGGVESNIIDIPDESVDNTSSETHEGSLEIVQDEFVGTVDLALLASKIAEQLDLSDPTIGKSLAISSKLVFQSKDAQISVYPNNRIPSDETGICMSFKDSLALIKLAIMFEATSVSFYKEKD